MKNPAKVIRGWWLCRVRKLHSPIEIPYSPTDERKALVCARCGIPLQKQRRT